MQHINQDNVEMLRNLPHKVDISLNDWCMAFYNAKIFPLPEEEYELFGEVAKTTIELLPEYPYKGRVNEFGNHMENVLIAGIKKVLGADSVNLGTGYPDVYFKYNGKHYYPESKVGQDLSKEPDGFRMFYTSAPAEKTIKTKNIQDGHHILFHFEHAMPKGSKVGALSGNFKVSDLNGFRYKTENIQQGSAKHIYNEHNKVVTENMKYDK